LGSILGAQEASAGPGEARVGSGLEAGSGAEAGSRSEDLGRGGCFGPKATFSALFAAEMRFFKTHGFVKPLLREMLFRSFCIWYLYHQKAGTNPKRLGMVSYAAKRGVAIL